MAAQDAQTALTDMQRWPPGAHRMDRFWFSMQSIIVASANVSKALWGSGRAQKKIVAQRAPLRESLGIEDGSPFELRDLRNHLEHFDERLEEWLKKSERQ